MPADCEVKDILRGTKNHFGYAGSILDGHVAHTIPWGWQRRKRLHKASRKKKKKKKRKEIACQANVTRMGDMDPPEVGPQLIVVQSANA